MTTQDEINAHKRLASQKVFVPTVQDDKTLETFSVLLGFFMGLGYAFHSAFVHAFDLYYNKNSDSSSDPESPPENLPSSGG